MKNEILIEKLPDAPLQGNNEGSVSEEQIKLEASRDRQPVDDVESCSEEHSSAEAASLRELLTQLATEHQDSRNSLANIEDEIARLKMDDTVLTEMHQRNRELAENFHEREFLIPILLSLIGITDRIYQQIDEAKSKRDTYKSSGTPFMMRTAQFVIEQREADLIEIENTLANFGVERFLTADATFQPQVHKCVQRIETKQEELVGHIQRRILPGYTRNTTTLRKERVTVFVEVRPTDNLGDAI